MRKPNPVLETKINIRVNENVSPGMFCPDPLIPGGHMANSLTIRALKTDLSVVGDDLDEFSTPYQCPCGKELDLQFWKLCPYCAQEIRT